MKIRLNEIPEDGRQFTYDQKTAELTPALTDLISNHDYAVDLYIKPLGSAYEVRGMVKTSIDELCSHCGYDFELPINRKVNEILIEDEDKYRKVQGATGNQSVDFLGSGPSMATIRGTSFDVGEFVHETIAVATPSYPTCGPNGSCLHEEEVSQIITKLEEEAEVAVTLANAPATDGDLKRQKPVGHPAFSVLQNLDLKVKKN